MKMTRREQIEEWSMIYGPTVYGKKPEDHFIAGAEKADSHPHLNELGKEALLVQACYKKIERLEKQNEIYRKLLKTAEALFNGKISEEDRFLREVEKAISDAKDCEGK